MLRKYLTIVGIQIAGTLLAVPTIAGSMPTDPSGNGDTANSPIAQVQQPTRLSGVKVAATGNGIQISLDRDLRTSTPSIVSRVGNTITAEIPNAVLVDGREFRATTPIDRISAVVISQINPTTVRVSVTGTSTIPRLEWSTSEGPLILSAMPTGDDDDVDLDLIVTPQKRPETAQNVPISLTVIPRQQIEDAGIRSVADVANNTPNFRFNSSSSGRQFSYYSLRGLSNSNFLARRDTIGFYIDEVPYEYGGFIDLDLVDLERVEVLRGPQSTLYGRNSQAGVVNIFTRQPGNRQEFRSSFSYGSYNERDLRFSANFPLVRDNLALNIAGGYRAHDGFHRNTFLNESAGQQSSLTGRVQLLWTPHPDLAVSFNSNVSSQDDGDILYSPRTTPLQIGSNVRGFLRNNTNTQALKVAYNARDYRLTSVTTRRFSIQDGENDGDNSPVDLFQARYGFNDTVWTQELRLQSPSTGNRNLLWTLGTYLESSDFDAREGSAFSAAAATAFGLPAAGTDLISGRIGQQTYAVFGQLDYRPIEPLTITGGLRYESSNLRLSSRQRSFTPIGSTTPAFVSGIFDDVRGSDSELLPRIGVQYRFSPEVAVYASATRGYKPGSYNYRADTVDVQRIQPERSWNYEIGVKTSLWDNRVTANLALFSHSIDNYQLALQDNTGFFRNVVNAGVGITGLELEVNANPSPGFNLIAGVGLSDAKFTNYVNPFTNVNRTGNKLPFASSFTYNLAAQYRSPAGLFGRLELLGTGQTFFDDANRIGQEPYAVVNARIGYENQNYGVYLFANNLFDTRYINAGFEFPPPNIIATFGTPATYGMQFKTNF
jgi:iron complex outermembrane recepter protein